MPRPLFDVLGRQAAAGLRAAARRLGGPCAICRQWGAEGICSDCRQLHVLPRERCDACGLALPVPGRCAVCLRDPPPFVRTQIAVDYAFPWDRLVADLKFGAGTDLAGALGALFASRLHPGPVSLLVPVPLAPERLAQRGYNQAGLLAQALSARLGVPVVHDLLQRPVDRRQQAALSREDRLNNLRGAFLVEPARRGRLAGHHVALVDDVMTTGATAREASAELRRAGAAAVEVWAFARTP